MTSLQNISWPASPDAAWIYQNLLRCYGLCVKGKPKLKLTQWHWRAEQELYQLSFALQAHRYVPSVSSVFMVLLPRPREIIASHIRDRVVHRMVYEYMSPYWEQRFMQNSFACRKAKGPLRAVTELEGFIAAHKRSTRAQLYYLKVDISRFFPSINHTILVNLLHKKLENPFFRWLVELLVRHRPTAKGCYQLHSPKHHWSLLEAQKSLFKVPMGQGLPIGNLTSQFFANVYMHELDVYLTQNRKHNFLYWQRYVDDIVILGEDPQNLKKLVPKIQSFIQDQLHLVLNPKKTQLQPLRHGLDHLGYFIKPSHTTIRRSVSYRVRNRLMAKNIDPSTALMSLQSALGHATHGKNSNWRLALLRKVSMNSAVPKFKCDLNATVVQSRLTQKRTWHRDDLWISLNEKRYQTKKSFFGAGRLSEAGHDAP